MKFTAICGIAAAIASQANAFGTYIRCSAEQLTEEDNGIDREEKATIGFFQANPINGEEQDKHGFGFFSGMEEAEEYEVRIYENDLLEGEPCNYADNVMHRLGTFEESWNGMTCAALDIPVELQLLGDDSINGHIAALVNEEGLITTCCRLHDGSGDRRLAAEEVEGVVDKEEREDVDINEEEDGEKRRLADDFEGQIDREEREDDGGDRRLESWEYDPQLDKQEREDDGGDRRLKGCLVPGVACVESAYDDTNGGGFRRLQDEGRIDKVDLDDDEFGGHRRLQDEGRIDKVDLDDDEFGGHRLLQSDLEYMCHHYGMFCKSSAIECANGNDGFCPNGRHLEDDDHPFTIDDAPSMTAQEDNFTGGRLLQALMFEEFGIPDGF